MGDGGHRFNRLMNKLSEADDEGYGYIDEETFLDTIFIHLRTRHRPSVEESQWLVEQLHVKNKRFGSCTSFYTYDRILRNAER